MDQDNTGLDYLKVDHPAQKSFAEHQSTVTENATETLAEDPHPARRERSSTDSTKSGHDNKTSTGKGLRPCLFPSSKIPSHPKEAHAT